jgi:hypothetical protein
MCDRRAEERQEGVAGVLLHDAPKATDHVAESGDDRIDHLQQLLRVDPTRELAEPREIREQRRYEPPLRPQCRCVGGWLGRHQPANRVGHDCGRLAGARGAAVTAENRVVQVRRRAR